MDIVTLALAKKYVDQKGAGISVEIVTELPTIGNKNTIYFISNGNENENFYDEYMFIQNKWESIGTTKLELSNYATKEDLKEAINDAIGGEY